MIYKSIKNGKNDESIWLVMNILLPIVGCIVYKLTHKKINEQQKINIDIVSLKLTSYSRRF